ncbi:MAG: hypothetical protein JWQ07_5425 [Ramlibacter sp.]|nr:hypothetical protein [Ramlibacter sp.]
MEIAARCASCRGIHDAAGRVSGRTAYRSTAQLAPKRQLSQSTRVVIQRTMIVRAIFGEGPLLAASSHSQAGEWEAGSIFALSAVP